MSDVRTYIFFTILMWITIPSTLSFAHGLPSMCEVDKEVLAQCGPDHTCDVREEISKEIGVCQEPITSYQTCDLRRMNEDCEEGFACRIGELSPHIGACIKDNTPKPNVKDDPPEEDPDESCSSTSGGLFTPMWLVGLLWLGLGRRRKKEQAC